MYRLLGLIVALVFAALPRFAHAEEISAFSSDIGVAMDGSVAVTERIDYSFDGPAHVIVRDIPTNLPDGHAMSIEPGAVDDGSGNAVRSSISTTMDGVRFTLGDPRATAAGQQAYVLRYVASGALRYFDDRDELRWNVSGDSWTVPIRRIAATVRLPAEIPMEQVSFACYTGAAGSTEKNCLMNRQGNAVSFVAEEPLVIVVGWPHGIVAKLDARLPTRPVAETIAETIVLALPLLVALACLTLWWARGRDSKGVHASVARHDPPKDMTPAEVGLLVDQRVGMPALAATVVDLAIRGYLNIREIERNAARETNDFEFVSLKEYAEDPSLRSHERGMLSALFGGDHAVRMLTLAKTDGFQKKLRDVRDGLYADMTKDGYFAENPQKIRGAFIGVGFALLLAIVYFGESAIRWFGGAIAALPGALFVAGATILGFSFIMPKRTEKGVAALAHARGFRSYLSTAEKNGHARRTEAAEFERWAPYAMAFGVVGKWSKAFAELDVPRPRWYEGVPGASFSAASLATSLQALGGVFSMAGLEAMHTGAMNVRGV